MDETKLFSIIVSVALVMFSAIIHEIAHGVAALACGDPTAKEAGRLTLNPVAHLDLIGSVLLPIFMVLINGPMFAWAKPVPYNPHRLRHRRVDEVIVALAGPAANFLQALLGVFCLRFMYDAYLLNKAPELLIYIISTYVYINLVLMCFNLLPLPPLDGSHLIGAFLPKSGLAAYYRFQDYALPVLIIFLYVLPGIIQVSPINIYLDHTASALYKILINAVL